MPWKERTAMFLREEFVRLALSDGSNVTMLCERFGISRKTAYKWMARDRQGQSLADQSRRPSHSPRRTEPAMERRVVQLREAHRWGGRKIAARLKALRVEEVPAPSTVTDILRRHGQIDPQEAAAHAPLQRFEHPCPNDLWQMDFKGQFRLVQGPWCFPLTILDDHSRFSLALRACPNQQGPTVQGHLTDVFRRYRLPSRILCDNGPPWGCDGEHRYTALSAWMIRLGIAVSHGRPYHPQTQGKDERFHRSLNVELLKGRAFGNADDAQGAFDLWRDVYNLERPHEALAMGVPASRYPPSARAFPEALLPIEYEPADIVRWVQVTGYFQYGKRKFRVSQAFAGNPVALRPTTTDGVLDVYFCHQKVSQIDLKKPFTGA